MPSPYSEAETEQYYDHEDAVYRALWDKDGSVHWGLFEDGANMSFLEAGANLNKVMARRGQLDPQSDVIDVGCGSGTTAIALCKSYGCRVTGVDLSGVRIANAIDSLEEHPREVQEKVDFKKGSATDLPIDDETLHPRLEPGDHLPRPRQGQGAGRGLPGAEARRHLRF